MKTAFGLLIYLAVYFKLCSIVSKQADFQKRSKETWFIIAVLFNPLTAYLLLWIDDAENRVPKIDPNQIKQRHITNNDMECPSCGQSVNPITRDGLQSPEDEPWTLICENCNSIIQPR